MSPRPAIFISTVSKELKSSRQLVSNTLQFLGYEPVWQDIFGTEQGDLRAMLRDKIDDCKGVVQLVGKCYGAEPPAPDEQFGRVSYTQYEALYAKQRGKKVWYLLLDDDFPGDAHEAEPEELRELQAAYRRRLKSQSQLYHPLNSREALEASVLKLRNDLTRLRRGVRQWAIGVAALLIGLTVLVSWILHGQREQTKIIQKQGVQVSAIVDRYQKMQEALVKLAEVESRESQSDKNSSPEERRARAYAVLEKELGLGPGSLARELPAFALELYNRSDTTLLMRARAAYALNKFEEAEKLSLEAAKQDQQGYENAKQVADERRKKIIEDYKLAGRSAEKQIQYETALNYYRKAAQLTDRARDPLEWAALQWDIAYVLDNQGQYADSARVYRDALEEYRRARGDEDKDVLAIRVDLANILQEQGKFGEAVAEYRNLIHVEEKALGPEDPNTLATRDNMAAALSGDYKYAEAEAEYRAAMKLEEKTLGPEDVQILHIRNNLATDLHHQGKYTEAEKELREVIRLETKKLGPEHPDTLATRMNLAVNLGKQGKLPEAEAEERSILKLREKMLGPEHPDTLASRHNLAADIYQRGDYVTAETEFRDILRLREKVLGPEHPDTLRTRMMLAATLGDGRKLAEAETELRKLIQLEDKVFGPENVETLRSRRNLAIALAEEKKYAEAETVCREFIRLGEKVLGPERPDIIVSVRSRLAGALKEQGKYAEAETEYRTVLKLQEKAPGPDKLNSDSDRLSLGACLIGQDKYDEAVAELRIVIQHEEKALGPEDSAVLIVRGMAADVLEAQQKYPEAEKEYREILRVEEKKPGPDAPDTIRDREKLAQNLESQRKYSEAETEYRRLLASREKLAQASPKDSKLRDDVIEAWNSLAWIQLFTKDFAGALASAEAGRKLNPSYLPLDTNRAHALALLGRKDEAEQIYLKHRGEKFSGDREWAAVILEDFRALEKAGLTNTEFARIRELFKAEPKPAASTAQP